MIPARPLLENIFVHQVLEAAISLHRLSRKRVMVGGPSTERTAHAPLQKGMFSIWSKHVQRSGFSTDSALKVPSLNRTVCTSVCWLCLLHISINILLYIICIYIYLYIHTTCGILTLIIGPMLLLRRNPQNMFLLRRHIFCLQWESRANALLCFCKTSGVRAFFGN